MVVGLQARVEQRAAQLRRDLGLLVARKRALLQRGAEEALGQEAEKDVQCHGVALQEQAKEAVQDIWAAVDETRTEYKAVLTEIDDHLTILNRVRTRVVAQ